MWIKHIGDSDHTLTIAIPLTRGTDKTRIKKRSFFNEYGLPVATKRESFSQSCYVEWQIGYDIASDDAEKLKLTTLKGELFTAANGKSKALYELSEYIYYFRKWDIVKKETLLSIKGFLQKLTDADFIDNPANFAIERSQPVHKRVLDIDFAYTQVKYPLLIHRFEPYEILVEIKLTEKQYALGVQSMLYFCFPITELNSDKPLLGRSAETKETADFVISRGNIDIFVNMVKIFGILSNNHNRDILAILEKIMS